MTAEDRASGKRASGNSGPGLFQRDFPLDGYQLQAAEAIKDGLNVLVSAPTGSGKTVVAEFAVEAALAANSRIFYTTPIKALSNQKFNDLRSVLGNDRVGLLTGDHALNPEAPVVVMTTEVLRNMAYAASPALDNLGWVVLDEVHFLQDRYRGPVWEEVLIHTPASVRFLCLSATVSNAAQLGEWISSIRGDTATVVEHRRPIALEHLLMVSDRQANELRLLPLLEGDSPNPIGRKLDQPQRATRDSRGRPRRRYRTPRRTEVIEELASEDLLPALFFIFSRKGCDEAARTAHNDGLRLTTPEESAEIRRIADSHVETLGDADLDVLGYDEWLEVLGDGIASHHAGLVPPFREAIEECFVQGLIKAVFATETLALGINMPARTVVIDRLTKFTGDGHEVLTPAQFTQLTGRAGRRGLDSAGTSVVLWNPFITFDQTARLAASKEFQLRSAFRPTYNMAANLVERYPREIAEEILTRSFAQYQSDRDTTSNRTLLDRLRAEKHALEAELSATTAYDPSSIAEYVELAAVEKRLRKSANSAESRRRFLSGLTVGDVIEVPTSKGARQLVVISTATRKGEPKVVAVTARANPVRLDAKSYASPPQLIAKVELPVPHLPNDAEFQRAAAQRLKRVNPKQGRRLREQAAAEALAEEDEYALARAARDAHPFHDDPDRALAIGISKKLYKLNRSITRIEKRITGGGGDLVDRFGGILTVLEAAGMLRDWSLTPSGTRLRRIFHESDLLVALALEAGVLRDLDAAGVAALVSCFTHEHRGSDDPPPPRLPSAELRARFGDLLALHGQLNAMEENAGVPLTREPSAGFAIAAHRWASGAALAEAVSGDGDSEDDLTGGDFVRNVKQLVDLLRQIAQVGDAMVGGRSRSAADALVRDIVAVGGSAATGDDSGVEATAGVNEGGGVDDSKG